MLTSFFRSLEWIFSLVPLIFVPLIFASAVAHAQPKLEMHRVGVNADDGSGWHEGISTKGAFSIRVPIPFNDFTTYDAGTGEVTHVIGGKSSEGIKFMAAELPITANTPADLGTIPKSFASKPANKVSDIRRQSKDGVEVLSFSVASAASSAYFRYIRTKGALYTLSIEYPNASRDVAAATKDKFFGSFKLKTKS
jgi:hypothetical protein